MGYAVKAREGKIGLDDLQGGVFTISNGGVYGSLLSTPILNPPQSGILGMHKIQERPVAEKGQVVVRPMMYLALSYDHRVVDGKEAVTFLIGSRIASRIRPGSVGHLKADWRLTFAESSAQNSSVKGNRASFRREMQTLRLDRADLPQILKQRSSGFGRAGRQRPLVSDRNFVFLDSGRPTMELDSRGALGLGLPGSS